VGVGFVGEHLLNTFKEKYNTIGVDLSPRRTLILKNKYKDVHFQSDYKDLEKCDVFLVSVPTLVTNEKEIDLSCLYSAKDALEKVVKPGALIMVESSVYVGATREIFGNFRSRGIYVGFSPERVDPGRIEPPMEEIPKVVSGVDEASLKECKEIYEKVFNKIVPVSSTECAEMCKLYENCFRMINIAYVNEIADMCEEQGINTKEMINASSTKPFGFMPFYPGIGVGGHCIPVNPYYLMRNGNLPVLEYSTSLMEKRPKKKAMELIEQYDCKKVLIIGIGFKKGESLLTNSPGYECYKELSKFVDVSVYDPVVQDCYMKNDIQFLKQKLFDAYYIKNNYDLVLVNLKMEEDEKNIIKMYEKLGGNVYEF
jgi:nucleotide sugar dehydrogenase